jgi:hypothetical protein
LATVTTKRSASVATDSNVKELQLSRTHQWEGLRRNLMYQIWWLLSNNSNHCLILIWWPSTIKLSLTCKEEANSQSQHPQRYSIYMICQRLLSLGRTHTQHLWTPTKSWMQRMLWKISRSITIQWMKVTSKRTTLNLNLLLLLSRLLNSFKDPKRKIKLTCFIWETPRVLRSLS